MSTIERSPLSGSATASRDAFERLRISSPTTLFDYQAQYDTGTLLWENVVAGAASATHNANQSGVNLICTTASGDKLTRQTRAYHRYQPGKSQLVLFTFVLAAGKANVDQRVGYFDDDNGIFLELSGTTLQIVRRSKATGSIVDTEVTQDNWNLTTAPELDITKSQFFVIDLEWLGAGSVRCGFVIDGAITYVHQFRNANVLSSVYMTTANLPVRYEIENTGEAASGTTMVAICSSVISEGGFETGRGYPFQASNGITTIAVTTRRPILSIRAKASFNSIVNRGTIALQSASAYAQTNAGYFEIVYNGSLTGASFASVNTSSICERDISATAISGGITIGAFYAAPSGSGVNSSDTIETGILSRLPICLDKSGANPIPVSVVATSFSGTCNASAALSWQELR